MKKTMAKNKEPEWKYMCFRFIGRSRRLESFKAIKAKSPSFPEQIIDQEKLLIQKAYDEMRDAVIADPLYKETWERKYSETQEIKPEDFP